jgi:sarcosine/dimethylglycine N-methyltransferase
MLNRLTGLDDRIAVHMGSALDMPFPDDSFDAVWMQDVGMNIAGKRKLYAEICRVLRPGGRFAFQEMAAGNTRRRLCSLVMWEPAWSSDAPSAE